MVTYADGKVTCVHDFSNYWGRRGPSVHLGYTLPQGNDYEWFYNEVTVPQDGEVMHSYYMVAGFGEGYFGMQYNSKTERRILFSVWSPFDTQDPRNIPEDQRIRMLRRGDGVRIGEFGNEGSGGQSFMNYPWKAGTTYPFLMHVRPDGKGNTIYTAYFMPQRRDSGVSLLSSCVHKPTPGTPIPILSWKLQSGARLSDAQGAVSEPMGTYDGRPLGASLACDLYQRRHCTGRCASGLCRWTNC